MVGKSLKNRRDLSRPRWFNGKKIGTVHDTVGYFFFGPEQMTTYGILHTEWSNNWGGQEIRILDECLGMAERGHKVELCGVPDGRLRLAAEKAGLFFHPLSMAGPWDLPALFRLGALAKRRGLSIIHTHSSVDSWLGGMAARVKGLYCVRTRHLSVPVNRHPLNFVYRLPHAVTTTGEGIARHLVEDYGLDPGRVRSVPTGVDTERFAPADPDPALMAELGLTPGAPVVAIVAILRSWKRHDLFCEMAGMVLEQKPEARFLIVGGGPGEKRINGYLDGMGLRPKVIMTGHRGDVERILPLVTVQVLCSDQGEGVPQAVLQGLSCERAVVGTDAGGIGQVVRHENTGLLVPPGDARALAGAVTRLIEDPGLCRSLGRAGRKMVMAEHSREIMLDKTEEVYALIGAPALGEAA